MAFFGRLLGFRRFEASAGTFPESEQVLNAVLEGDLKIAIHGENLVTGSCGPFLCEKAASLQSQFGFVTELLDFEVSSHTRGLSGNIDDAQIIQRAFHFIELRGIEFLANIEQSRSRLALLVDGHRRWIPLRFAYVVSDIGIVVRDELKGVLIRRKERVVAYTEGFDVVGAEFEQIRFDPLFEVGAQRSGVDFSDVDHVFGGDTNEPLFGVLRILFSDDEVDERIPFGVAELDEHPNPFAPFGLLLLIGLENTEEFLVVPFLACDIEHLEADE